MFDQVTQFLSSQLTNQFFTGGFILGIITSVVMSLKHVPGLIFSGFKKTCIYSVDIPDNDSSFPWIQYYLSQDPTISKFSKKFTVNTVHSGKNNTMVYSPAPGLHFILFNKKLILIERIRKEKENTGGYTRIGYNEYLYLYAFSFKNIATFINQARDNYRSLNKGVISIYEKTQHSWVPVASIPKETTTVCLPKGVMSDLKSDVGNFVKEKDWYTKVGVPYRRGYLLFGPPGTGKTTTVAEVAASAGLDVYVIQLSRYSDATLRDTLLDVPAESIVLIEDVDCSTMTKDRVNQQNDEDGMGDSLTLSGILNAIDGIATPQGRILFMTTNHKETLDPALLRPGRLDYHLEISYADSYVAESMFTKFFPDSGVLATEFGSRIKASDVPVSPAQIQEHLTRYKRDPFKACSTFLAKV